jgi:hypothetical protein
VLERRERTPRRADRRQVVLEVELVQLQGELGIDARTEDVAIDSLRAPMRVHDAQLELGAECDWPHPESRTSQHQPKRSKILAQALLEARKVLVREVQLLDPPGHGSTVARDAALR